MFAPSGFRDPAMERPNGLPCLDWGDGGRNASGAGWYGAFSAASINPEATGVRDTIPLADRPVVPPRPRSTGPVCKWRAPITSA